MTDDSEFITRLIGFGLSEKEARVYVHLMKYGPNTPSPLAKSCKTYREDVHRTLTALIEKGMVRPSLDSPTVYAAVDLDTALETALKERESELREMERAKRELQGLVQQRRFYPTEEVASFRLIKRAGDIFAAELPLIRSTEHEFLVITPPEGISMALLTGVIEATKELVERGGSARVITYITYPIIEIIEQMLSYGMEVRHRDEGTIQFLVFDRKTSMSAINVDNIKSLKSPVSLVWTDDATYAQYLASTFELVWSRSRDACERIEELLKQGPPQV
jgi:sugar-specific transcriptional regulator TrmB